MEPNRFIIRVGALAGALAALILAAMIVVVRARAETWSNCNHSSCFCYFCRSMCSSLSTQGL